MKQDWIHQAFLQVSGILQANCIQSCPSILSPPLLFQLFKAKLLMDIYTLKIVTDFAAAHTLRNYQGACNRLHGHNWKVEIVVKATQLDDAGMGIDFKVIKKETKAIADRLDHYYLNDIPPFDKINPTAENLAKYFYDELSQALSNEVISVESATLWETERACATYSKNRDKRNA